MKTIGDTNQLMSAISMSRAVTRIVAQEFDLTESAVRMLICLSSIEKESGELVTTSQLRERLDLTYVGFYKVLDIVRDLDRYVKVQGKFCSLTANGELVVRSFRLLLRQKLKTSKV